MLTFNHRLSHAHIHITYAPGCTYHTHTQHLTNTYIKIIKGRLIWGNMAPLLMGLW